MGFFIMLSKLCIHYIYVCVCVYLCMYMTLTLCFRQDGCFVSDKMGA